MHLWPDEHRARGTVDISSTHRFMSTPSNADSAVFVVTPRECAIRYSFTSNTMPQARLASQHHNRMECDPNERTSHRHSSDCNHPAVRWRLLHRRSLAFVGGDCPVDHRCHCVAAPFHWRAQEFLGLTSRHSSLSSSRTSPVVAFAGTLCRLAVQP